MKRFSVLVELLINLGGPLIIYHLVKDSMSTTPALLLSSLPPIVWAVIQLVRNRTVDAVALLVITGIALSLIATLLGGSPRLLLVRESFVTGLIGLIFLGSLLWRRPMLFYIVRSSIAKEGGSAEEFTAKWSIPRFRETFYLMTRVWGIGLVAEAVIKFFLAFSLPIELFLVLAPVLGYGIYFGLLGWSIWFGQKRKKQGERIAAAAAARGASGDE
jgi:intracellular septation protein A